MSAVGLSERLPVVARRGRAVLAAVADYPVWKVLTAFVVAEWVVVLATALVVRHAGWIYYQGGDQLWYYTLGWLLGHGELTQTPIGYLYSALLAPLARVAGPNLVSALPVIVLVQVIVLLPVAMLATYGIAVRIGGKLFAYWVLLLWLVVPFVGVLYTNQGYHQRYTELFLPQAFGLTAMADFPAMVAAVVSAYFCARVIFGSDSPVFDGIACGLAAGAAIAVKPSAVLFIAGPVLAFALWRRFAAGGAFVAGLVPAVVTLTVWKARGLGNIPLLHSSAHRAGELASAAPLAALNFGKYTRDVSWARFTNNIDLLREHFWSGRLIVWLVIAGTVGLARRSPRAAILVGGWFFAFVAVKGGYTQTSVEDASVFRVMMPAYPAFLLLLASLPYLLPHLARRPAAAPTPAWSWRPRARLGALAAAVVVTAVLPLTAIAASSVDQATNRATLNSTPMPVPVNVDVKLEAKKRGPRVDLSWRTGSPFGGPVFYRVWRSRTDKLSCPTGPGGTLCSVSMSEIGVTRQGVFSDLPPKGRSFYRIAVAANWLDDPQYGDPYFLSRAVTVDVP